MSKKYETEVKIIEKYYRHLTSKDVVLRDIKSIRVLHGGGFKYEKNEKEVHSPIREIATKVAYKHEEITSFDLESFCTKLYEMTINRVEQIHKMMYDEISNITELTGNKVDARGSKFEPELILQMLEKIEIRFDENGEPILPELHVSKETYKQIKDSKFTYEQRIRHNEIIEKKKKQWYAKKCYRKLSYID